MEIVLSIFNVYYAQEKVSNGFDKYIGLLQKEGITDKFIANIEMVYNKCEMTEPFGQADIQEW